MDIISIDPGQSGGVAVYSHIDASIEIFVMPTVVYKTVRRKSKRGKDKGKWKDYPVRKIDIPTLTSKLSQYMRDGAIAYIEDVGVMPDQGGVSNFNFGRGFGRVLGMLEAWGVPVTQVRPMVWQKSSHEPQKLKKNEPGYKDAKERSLIACQRIFPNINTVMTPRASKPHDGVIDALLIGYHGFLMEYGNGL